MVWLNYREAVANVDIDDFMRNILAERVLGLPKEPG